MIISEVIRIKIEPIIDVSVRELCRKPYYNHPKGCPNYGKRATCPPICSLWHDVCEIRLATFLYYTKFNLKQHVEKMRIKHPGWSDKQLSCVLYWQNTARKPLKNLIEELKSIPGFFVTICPEAMGINVTAMMNQIGIDLEWPAVNYAYQVAMGGWLK